MLKVALYGGAGSGKSTVAELFADLGTPIIDADVIARELVISGSPQLQQIVAVFGAEIVKNNQLDRAALRRIIFSDKEARIKLNNIMHPSIRIQLKRRIDDIDAPYCVVVIPLLLEAQMMDLVDCVVVIDCPRQTQIERIVLRDGLSVAEATQIVSVQATREQRLEVSNQVVDNSLDINHLKQQVNRLHKQWTK